MADTAADLLARLGELHATGQPARDPVRHAYFEGMARRAAAQPPTIRAPLLARLNRDIDAWLAKADEITPPETAAEVSSTPLAALLNYIGGQAHPTLADTATPASATVDRKNQLKRKKPMAGQTATAPELKAVAYFRDAWSRLSTEQQLTQTLAQAPDNAGPMNSQHLVLRSLQLMRDTAPEYLQGFMTYIDTLIWLDQADPTRAVAMRTSGGESEKKPRATKRSTVAKRKP